MTGISQATDFLLRSLRSGPIVAVEAKNSDNLTSENAVAYRRNMLAHGELRHTPFFMLVSQDTGYLWGPDGDATIEAPPVVSFSMAPVIARYADRFNAERRIHGRIFELIIHQWLDDIVHTRDAPVVDPDHVFDRSGLLSLIRSQPVVIEVGS